MFGGGKYEPPYILIDVVSGGVEEFNKLETGI